MKKIINFIKQSFAEVKNISWLDKRELITSSISVLFVVFLFSIFFLLVDLGLSNAINFIL